MNHISFASHSPVVVESRSTSNAPLSSAIDTLQRSSDDSRRSRTAVLLQRRMFETTLSFIGSGVGQSSPVPYDCALPLKSQNASVGNDAAYTGTTSQNADLRWTSVARFVDELRSASLRQPREDGLSHPVDSLIEQLSSCAYAGDWLVEAFRRLYGEPGVLADLVYGLTRTTPMYSRATALAVPALTHRSSVVRESATRLIESWKIVALRDELLTAATRERSAWLAGYMRSVAQDIA